jgi:hypothetical protein
MPNETKNSIASVLTRPVCGAPCNLTARSAMLSVPVSA